METQDGSGQPVQTWRTYRTVRAGKEESSGNESTRGAQQEHRGRVRFTFWAPRNRPETTVYHRATWQEFGTTRTANIVHTAQTDDLPPDLILECVEV